MSALAPHIAAFRALARAYGTRSVAVDGETHGLALYLAEQAAVYSAAAADLEAQQAASYQVGATAGVTP